jgi:hypothetical protein
VSWWLFERYYLNTTGAPFHAPCNPSEFLRWLSLISSLISFLHSSD